MNLIWEQGSRNKAKIRREHRKILKSLKEQGEWQKIRSREQGSPLERLFTDPRDNISNRPLVLKSNKCK